MLTDEQIKALRDGCEGVTPGPWWWHPPTETDNDTCEIVCDIFSDEISIADYANKVNAAHIARCDPQTIRELCTRVLASEARVKVLEDALRPLVGARWGHDEDGWLLVKGVSHDELDRARKALEEAPKAPL